MQTNASVEQAASLRDFTDKPLVVLTAVTGSAASWSAKQEALANLSTDSVHRVINGTDHAGIADEKGAAATTRAILTSSPRSKAHRPLAR